MNDEVALQKAPSQDYMESLNLELGELIKRLRKLEEQNEELKAQLKHYESLTFGLPFQDRVALHKKVEALEAQLKEVQEAHKNCEEIYLQGDDELAMQNKELRKQLKILTGVKNVSVSIREVDKNDEVSWKMTEQESLKAWKLSSFSNRMDKYKCEYCNGKGFHESFNQAVICVCRLI